MCRVIKEVSYFKMTRKHEIIYILDDELGILDESYKLEKFVLSLFFRTWEENLWRFHWSKNVWSDFIHVVEAWIVRVVTFTSDVETNQRRHVCHHLRHKRLQRIHQSPAHRELFISLRIFFEENDKIVPTWNAKNCRIRRDSEWVSTSFFKIWQNFLRWNSIETYKFVFRTSSMYGSEYQWFELKKLDQYWWKLKTLKSIQ